MDKTEFDAMVNGGYDHKTKWKGEKYRMTVITSTTVPGRPQTDFSTKTITEFGPSMVTRSTYANVYGGKPAPARESVRIGNWLYTRSGTDAWIRKEYVASGSTPKEPEPSPRKILTSQAEYKYRGQSTLSDRPVHIYIKTLRETGFNEKSGENYESESTNKYWIDAKGTVLKNEYRGENRGKITSQTSVSMEYVIDPSIIITAPEIAP